MIRQPPSCLGIAPSPEHRRLGNGGVCVLLLSFLGLSTIMLVCCKAELRCLALAVN